MEGGVDAYMSSSGEMKMSLKLMICHPSESPCHSRRCQVPTFSCLKCFSSFSSRYVRFERTGVLKGFMIFFMATAWLVSWSLAELRSGQCGVFGIGWKDCTIRGRTHPCPRAAGRCICMNVSSARSAWRGICLTCSLSRKSCQKSARERILPS